MWHGSSYSTNNTKTKTYSIDSVIYVPVRCIYIHTDPQKFSHTHYHIYQTEAPVLKSSPDIHVHVDNFLL